MCEMKMPDGFEKVDSMPEDPPDSMSYMRQSEGALAFVLAYPVSLDEAMPFDSPRSIIDGIHNSLGEDQGLIEVKADKTKSGKPYIYSIVKSAMPEPGMQYTLTMDIGDEDYADHIQGFFSESGITGMRDAAVFAAFQNEGGTMEDWMSDPYDPTYERGIRMNRSEVAELDASFPAHPLSKCREFVQEIVNSN